MRSDSISRKIDLIAFRSDYMTKNQIRSNKKQIRSKKKSNQIKVKERFRVLTDIDTELTILK